MKESELDCTSADGYAKDIFWSVTLSNVYYCCPKANHAPTHTQVMRWRKMSSSSQVITGGRKNPGDFCIFDKNITIYRPSAAGALLQVAPESYGGRPIAAAPPPLQPL